MPLLLVPMLLSVSGLSGFAQTAGEFARRAYSAGGDTLAYRLYVPSGYNGETPTPLIVMLHGCTQSADDFAAGTGMNALAEERGFLVAYPEQPASAHPQRCWNWYDPAHQRRGAGEPALIAGITRTVMEEFAVDERRIYVAGMSAGGAMAAIMGATYPDVFAAVAVHSGLPYRAAAGAARALGAMRSGGADADALGTAAARAAGEHRRAVPVIVFHGAADPVVAVANAHEALAQWAQTADLAGDGRDDDSVDAIPERERRGRTPAGYHYTRSLYTDARGAVVLEKWIVDELGHAWSGGSPAGSYTDPKGPAASREIVRFFFEHPRDARRAAHGER